MELLWAIQNIETRGEIIQDRSVSINSVLLVFKVYNTFDEGIRQISIQHIDDGLKYGALFINYTDYGIFINAFIRSQPYSVFTAYIKESEKDKWKSLIKNNFTYYSIDHDYNIPYNKLCDTFAAHPIGKYDFLETDAGRSIFSKFVEFSNSIKYVTASTESDGIKLPDVNSEQNHSESKYQSSQSGKGQNPYTFQIGSSDGSIGKEVENTGGKTDEIGYFRSSSKPIEERIGNETNVRSKEKSEFGSNRYDQITDVNKRGWIRDESYNRQLEEGIDFQGNNKPTNSTRFTTRDDRTERKGMNNQYNIKEYRDAQSIISGSSSVGSSIWRNQQYVTPSGPTRSIIGSIDSGNNGLCESKVAEYERKQANKRSSNYFTNYTNDDISRLFGRVYEPKGDSKGERGTISTQEHGALCDLSSQQLSVIRDSDVSGDAQSDIICNQTRMLLQNTVIQSDESEDSVYIQSAIKSSRKCKPKKALCSRIMSCLCCCCGMKTIQYSNVEALKRRGLEPENYVTYLRRTTNNQVLGSNQVLPIEVLRLGAVPNNYMENKQNLYKLTELNYKPSKNELINFICVQWGYDLEVLLQLEHINLIHNDVLLVNIIIKRLIQIRKKLDKYKDQEIGFMNGVKIPVTLPINKFKNMQYDTFYRNDYKVSSLIYYDRIISAVSDEGGKVGFRILICALNGFKSRYDNHSKDGFILLHMLFLRPLKLR